MKKKKKGVAPSKGHPQVHLKGNEGKVQKKGARKDRDYVIVLKRLARLSRVAKR